MTIYDNALTFSTAQAVTAAVISTNVIDLEAVRDLGIGGQLSINTLITTTFTDISSDSSLAVILQCSAATNSGFVPAPVVATTPTFAYQLGTTSALSIFPSGQACFIIPPLATPSGTATMVGLGKYTCSLNPLAIVNRYIALYYLPMSGNLSAGAVTSFISGQAEAQSYPTGGYTIS